MRIFIPLVVVGIVWFFFYSTPGHGQQQSPLKSLQGSWRLVSIDLGDEKTQFSNLQPRWKIVGDKVIYGGEELGRIQVDPSTTPVNLDIAFLEPKRTMEGIYEVDKDTLRICLNKQTDGIKERPEKFTTRGKMDFRLLTFQRDRNPPADVREGLPAFVGVALMVVPKKSELQVNALVGNSPAKKAGLREKDVILKINNMAFKELLPAVQSIRQAKPGDTISFLIRREGQERNINVQASFMPFRWIAELD